MKDRRLSVVFTGLSLIGIAYITLLSRTPTLTRVIHFRPFWSYMSAVHANQILLNIVLFIPAGFFLSDALGHLKYSFLWTGLATLLISFSVELLQFVTYRGMLDVDDLGTNFLGAVIGFLICSISGRNRKHFMEISIAMLCAVVVGCFFASSTHSFDKKRTEEFEFSILSVRDTDDKLFLEGLCYAYYRNTPEYSILFNGVGADTVITGDKFTVKANALSEKASVMIKFNGYPAISTGTYLSPSPGGTNVEYVPGMIPVVEGVPNSAVLKCSNEEYDTLIYEDGNELLWLIGWPNLGENTEIIYHIHTTETDKLPSNRIQYGFDNRGFRPDINSTANEIEPIGHYRVFKNEIPQEYPVTAIAVGFNTDGVILWTDSFRVQR